MKDIEAILLDFEFITVHPHFKAHAYKVKDKIFMTHNTSQNRICVKLDLIDQSAFIAAGRGLIKAVPNKWGKQGWTLVSLESIHPDLLKDAVDTAYVHVLSTVKPKKSKQ